MTSFELVLTACLSLSGDVCKEIRIPIMAERVTPFGCIMYGQMKAAEWTVEHPEWVVKRFGCERRKETV